MFKFKTIPLQSNSFGSSSIVDGDNLSEITTPNAATNKSKNQNLISNKRKDHKQSRKT